MKNILKTITLIHTSLLARNCMQKEYDFNYAASIAAVAPLEN